MRPTRESREKGTATVLAMFFTILVSGIIFTGSMMMKTNRRQTETNFRLNSQAMEFARAGLIESLSWFRRQTAQPVLAFNPVVDTTSKPPIIDTDDPDIGLVREFRIDGDVYGRYEIWKEWDDDPDPTRLAFRKQMQTHDMSIRRQVGLPGTAWRVRCSSYIFERVDENVSFRSSPNRMIATEQMEAEILRLKLSPPGAAAFCVRRGDQAIFETKSKVDGGALGAGVIYPSGTGTPTGSSYVSGSPRFSAQSVYQDDPKQVFGLDITELSGIADEHVTDPTRFPSPIKYGDLVVSEAGDITFTSARPLRGAAVVYIKGNVTISEGSASNFSGLLYVDGNLTMRAPAEIAGTVVVTGNLHVRGSGDFVTAFYDEEMLNAMRQEIGQYRLFGSIRPMHRRD